MPMKNKALVCILLASCGGGGGSGRAAEFVPSSNIAATHDYLRGVWMGTASTSTGSTGNIVLNLTQLPQGPAAAGAFFSGLPEIPGGTLQVQASGSQIRAESFPVTFRGEASAARMLLEWSSTSGATGTMDLTKAVMVVLR